MSDGRAPPAKKPFRECSFDREARIFRGEVSWADRGFLEEGKDPEGRVVHWACELSLCFGQQLT